MVKVLGVYTIFYDSLKHIYYERKAKNSFNKKKKKGKKRRKAVFF